MDEVIILDISATPNNRGPRFEEIKGLCENLFCPITVGGGVRTVGDFLRLLRDGADKVAIGTAAIEDPDLISRCASKVGNQSVVVSLDVDRSGHCLVRCGRSPSSLGAAEVVEVARRSEAAGAGEILLTSIDRDGTQQGYDLELISAVSQAVSIPVVAAGGCGSYEDMAGALRAGAHAVASGAMFQFQEATPKGASRYLKEHGFVTRV